MNEVNPVSVCIVHWRDNSGVRTELDISGL